MSIIATKAKWYKKNLDAIGVINLVRLQLGKYGTTTVGAPSLSYPVQVRSRSSDKWVFEQIYVEREYRCLDVLPDLPYIIDAGANVGYSSAYFLSRFPQSKILGIEPDAENFRQLKHNCKSYGTRFTAVQGAVWNERTTLNFSESTLGQGDEWGRQVQKGGGDIQAYTVPDLIRLSGFPRISLLKIDIEGAEREVFSGDTSWLSEVENIVIELHGAVAEQIFHQAIASRGYHISQCGELTVCLSS